MMRNEHKAVADPGGATGARPPKIGLTVIFYNHFVSECLKLGLR